MPTPPRTPSESLIRFGLSPLPGAGPGEPPVRAFAASLGRATGLGVEVRISPDYRGVVEALERGELDMGWLPPVVALRGAGRGRLILIALPLRRGSASFSAVLFARADAPFYSQAHLRGARVAWVDKQSAAGYIAPRAMLEESGMSLATLFAEELLLGSHAAVVRAVEQRRVDVGATYAQLGPAGEVLSASWVDAGSLSAFRVIASVGPIPSDVVAMSITAPALQGRAVQAALLSASPGTELGEACRALFQADGFERPSSEHLLPLGRLLEAAHDGARFPSSFPPAVK